MSSLFEEFNAVSAKQWKQKIQVDLKGADYNENLVWKTSEGIDVKPFYHRDDFSAPFAPVPGQPNSWQILQQVYIGDEAIANRLLLDAVNRGAEGLYLTSDKVFDLDKVFKNWDFNEILLYFNLKFIDEPFFKKLITYCEKAKARACFNLDLIGNLARTGNWFHNLKADHQILDAIQGEFNGKPILGVDCSLYQNAGATIVQQLAYGLAHANEYLNHFKDSPGVTPVITFKIAVGGNYFFEIAKIRALRKLYAALASEYGYRQDCSIFALPSKRNKTLYDYNLNMLRTTTECMSAVLGGANAVCNLPYDMLYHKSNEFGERISRNQLLILKAESYFDLVSNPADGAYYIESLTEQLAEKSLTIFKEIENAGGFLKSLKEGQIQKKIKESAAKEQQQFDRGDLVLVGTNSFTSAEDKMTNELELFPFVKNKPRKTLLEPIIERRLAEAVEQERLANEL